MKKQIWLPGVQMEKTQSLAKVRLAPRQGLGAVAQILSLTTLMHDHGMSAPVRLKDYLVDIRTLTVVLASEAITETKRATLDRVSHQEQLMQIAVEGLRLIRNPRLLGPEYEITGPEEMASLEFLVMMRQGIFPEAKVAYERAVEIIGL